MPPARSTLLDEATTWLVRTRDPAFRDWESFTAWLEADPARNDAYEAALDAHDVAAALGTTPAPIMLAPARTGEMAGRRRRAPVWAGAAAAVIVAAVAVPTMLPRHDTYVVATGPGEQRSVRLADGTTIAMNGGTRLTLDRRHARSVRLDAGEAMFSVVHDDANPFVVATGDTAIQDVGTKFNVVRAGAATEVAVAEGAVVYDPAGAAVKLTAGRTLHDPDVGMIEIGDADRAAIGSWREGRLVYRAAPLTTVAADIARMIGEPVQVSPAVAKRGFSGTILVRGTDRRRLFDRLGALLDVAVTHDDAGWQLAPRGSAAR